MTSLILYYAVNNIIDYISCVVHYIPMTYLFYTQTFRPLIPLHFLCPVLIFQL